MTILHIGCYTDEAPGGIVSFELDTNGVPSTWGRTTVARNPSFLSVAADALFAVEELPEGALLGFGRRGTSLAREWTEPSGLGPGHIALSADGGTIMVTNYGGGSVTAFRLDGGRVVGSSVWHGSGSGPNPTRQAGSHPHQCIPGHRGTWLVVDLGTDCLVEVEVRPDGVLAERGRVFLPPGSGPRHAAIAGAWLLVSAELDGMLHVLALTSSGYRWVGAVPASGIGPAGSNDPSHIEISPSGRHVYVANRGPDTISVFDLAPLGRGGMPLRVQEVSTGGEWPRHFALGEGRVYVANQNSDIVCVFDTRAGSELIGDRVASCPVSAPACVVLASSSHQDEIIVR